MNQNRKLQLASGLYIYAVTVFAIMLVLTIASGGQAGQEGFELFAEPGEYSDRMRDAGPMLRLVLLGDLFFIIGFGSAIGMTAWAYCDINRAAAWVAGLGILLVMGFDLVEDITLILSIDMVETGADLPAERILAQAQISAAKWLLSAVVVVTLTFVLPQQTLLERLLVWATRVLMPLGTGLFVTGAFDIRPLGALIILSAMFSGLVLLALTVGLRARAAGASLLEN